MQARQQARPAAPVMSDAEAQQIAAQNQGLTQEQMIAIAMMGKFVQNDVMGVKKAGLGGLKVSDVDMSKVMPSGIAKAMGLQPQQQVLPPSQQIIPQIQPILSPETMIASPAPPDVANLPFIAPNPVPAADSNQTEFDFNKKVRYEDIMQAIDKLENKIIILTNKINDLSTVVDKKKPKKNLDDGPQAG